MRGLAGRTAVVTGASGLIGRAIMRRLVEEDVTVWAATRSAPAITPECDQLTASGPGRAEPLEFDLADPSAISAAVALCSARNRLPQIVVGAASDRSALLDPQRVEPHRRLMLLAGVDVAGHALLAHEVVQHLPPGEGASIVLLSSMYAHIGVDPDLYPADVSPAPVEYGAAKAAVEGLTRNLALRWAGRGIRVNALVAGGVRAEARQSESFLERYGRRTPLGRMAEPDEIAAAAAFLASEEASYITGSSLVVDGGYTTR